MEDLNEKYVEEKIVLDNLSEVELFFIVQEIFSLPTIEDNPKLVFAYDYIMTLLPKYNVSDTKTYDSPKFYRWIKFWREWQGNLSIRQLKDIIDNIEMRKPYDQYLPKRKWNQHKPKVKQSIEHQG